jgi:hypothetical protein
MALLTACKEQEAPAQQNPVERFAEKINFKCPFLVDVDTRMDSVHILPDSTFQYNYTLVNQVRDKMDVMGLTAYIGSQLMETVRHSSTMKFHRDQQLRMIFYYRDRNGDFVTQIIIEPEDYQ